MHRSTNDCTSSTATHLYILTLFYWAQQLRDTNEERSVTQWRPQRDYPDYPDRRRDRLPTGVNIKTQLGTRSSKYMTLDFYTKTLISSLFTMIRSFRRRENRILVREPPVHLCRRGLGTRNRWLCGHVSLGFPRPLLYWIGERRSHSLTIPPPRGGELSYGKHGSARRTFYMLKIGSGTSWFSLV